MKMLSLCMSLHASSLKIRVHQGEWQMSYKIKFVNLIAALSRKKVPKFKMIPMVVVFPYNAA